MKLEHWLIALVIAIFGLIGFLFYEQVQYDRKNDCHLVSSVFRGYEYLLMPSANGGTQLMPFPKYTNTYQCKHGIEIRQ